MDLGSNELNFNNINSDFSESQSTSNKPEINIENGFVEKTAVITTELSFDCDLNIGESNVGLFADSRENEHQVYGEQSGINTAIRIDKEAIALTSTTNKKTHLTENISKKVNNLCGDLTEPSRLILEETLKSGKITNEESKKRKRGRPSKEEIRKAPIRESKRKRTGTYYMNYERDQSVWTKEDKEKFLRGLQEFGVDNFKDIVKHHLPHKLDTAVYNRIRNWKDRGRNDLENKLLVQRVNQFGSHINCILRLNDWLKEFDDWYKKSPSSLSVLSNVFILIAEYGDFPSINDCGGIDLRAMYRFLHCLLNGKPYYGVNQKTAEILKHCLSNSLRFMRTRNLPEEVIVDAYEAAGNQHKTYSRINKRFSPTSITNLKSYVTLPGKDPLHLSVTTFPKEYSQHEEDDEEEIETEEEEENFCVTPVRYKY